MNYPNKDRYQSLYARYVSGVAGRPVEEMLSLAGDLRGKRVLDLCGGAGELAIAAKQAGASESLLVDQSESMFDETELNHRGVKCHVLEVEHWLRIPKLLKPFDVVFCRQAVNYWLNATTAESLVCRGNDNIGTGGKFIFNTFNTAPPKAPTAKCYELLNGVVSPIDDEPYDGPVFVEVSWLVDDVVHHVQCREGYAPHVTQFRWISPDEFREILSPWFDVDVQTHGRTDMYVCTRY